MSHQLKPVLVMVMMMMTLVFGIVYRRRGCNEGSSRVHNRLGIHLRLHNGSYKLRSHDRLNWIHWLRVSHNRGRITLRITIRIHL